MGAPRGDDWTFGQVRWTGGHGKRRRERRTWSSARTHDPPGSCSPPAAHRQVITMTAPTLTPTPDLAAIKTRQQATWSSGDYGHIGVRLQIVGELLAEACDVDADQRVLDVAAGN